jgi:acyl carrier protein
LHSPFLDPGGSAAGVKPRPYHAVSRIFLSRIISPVSEYIRSLSAFWAAEAEGPVRYHLERRTSGLSLGPTLSIPRQASGMTLAGFFMRTGRLGGSPPPGTMVCPATPHRRPPSRRVRVAGRLSVMQSEPTMPAEPEAASTEAVVCELLRQKFDGDPKPGDRLTELDIDSLGMAELALELERKFQVHIDDSILDARTVAELARGIDRLKSKTA